MSASDYYDDDDRTVVGPYRGTMSDEVRARRAGYLAADFANRLDEDNFERMKTTRTTNPPSRRIALFKPPNMTAQSIKPPITVKASAAQEFVRQRA